MVWKEDVEGPAMASERTDLGYIVSRFLKEIELTKKMIKIHNQMEKEMCYLMFGDLRLAVSENEKARLCYQIK